MYHENLHICSTHVRTCPSPTSYCGDDEYNDDISDPHVPVIRVLKTRVLSENNKIYL